MSRADFFAPPLSLSLVSQAYPQIPGDDPVLLSNVSKGGITSLHPITALSDSRSKDHHVSDIESIPQRLPSASVPSTDLAEVSVVARAVASPDLETRLADAILLPLPDQTHANGIEDVIGLAVSADVWISRVLDQSLLHCFQCLAVL